MSQSPIDPAQVAIIAAQAAIDQYKASIESLTTFMVEHRDVCEYPPPLCPGQSVCDYLEKQSKPALENLVITLLQERVDRKLALKET